MARHLGQTLLSGLGIAFSLLLLTLTQASQRGTFEAVLREFEGLGQNSALLYMHENERLPPRFFEGLGRLSDNHQWRTLPIFESALGANAVGQPVQARVLFTDPDFTAVFQPKLAAGDPLREEDQHVNRAVIGSTLAEQLGISLATPHVKLGGEWYQVRGISNGLQAGGSQIHQFLNIREAALVVRPLDSLLHGNRPLKFVLIRTANREQLADVGRRFTHFLAESGLDHLRYDLRLPLKQNQLTARSQALLAAHGGLVGAVCLLLSCLGILISYQLQLRYRREEFGTLIALGASPAFIGKNLFAEVLLLVAGSGFAGMATGIAACIPVAWVWVTPMSPHPADWATSVGLLALVALATALPPALLARRFDPIELMRLHR
nr:ABC transporter permease [Acanthopleuribacter pedis]